MSQQDDQNEIQDEQLLDENGNPIDPNAEEQQEEEGGHKYAGIVSWVVSGALHATAILLAGTIYFLSAEPEQETPPVRVTNIPPPPVKKDEKPKDRELLDPKVELNVETKADVVAPITTLDLPDEKSEREEENDNPVPKGREEAVADSEQGGSGAFMAIGAGGGASGMFGSRTGGGRKRAVGKGGGSRGSESAVDAALRWFKKHQSPNGQWDAEKYFQYCTEDPKCEPGSLAGHGADEVNAAMTGYALLCFLGAGFDHKTPNKYKPVVKKGIDYLLSIQAPDGLLGKRNYEHPVATMALAEAYAMTSDPDLRKPAQSGIDLIIKRQNQDKSGGYGLGWDYSNPGNRNDTSVTGWNVMALKSAYAGGLTVGNSMEGAKHFLEKSWQDSNTNQEWCKDYKSLDPYKDISRYPYTWASDTGKIDISDWKGGKPNTAGHDMAPVGMVLAVFLGHRAGDPMLETLANYVMKFQTPTTYPCNTYYMYYNTLGVFQLGGDRWKVWNSVVRDMLVGAQIKGNGCLDGSWNWEKTVFHGNEVGRVLSTAYNTLCLEVYYRYAQVNQKH